MAMPAKNSKYRKPRFTFSGPLYLHPRSIAANILQCMKMNFLPLSKIEKIVRILNTKFPYLDDDSKYEVFINLVLPFGYLDNLIHKAKWSNRDISNQLNLPIELVESQVNEFIYIQYNNYG